MAQEELVERIETFLSNGKEETAVREILAQEGYSVEDVNGAFAIHALSRKPIGSNLMDRWAEDKKREHSDWKIALRRTVAYIAVLCVMVVTLDYYGFSVPLVPKDSIKTKIDSYMEAVVAGLP